MGGKGSGRVAAEKRNEELVAFIRVMVGVNNMLQSAENQLTRAYSRDEIPSGCYVTLFTTLREELNNVILRSLRLERHAKEELNKRHRMEFEGSE